MRNSYGKDASNYRHGGYVEHRSEYNSWRAMKERCLYPKYHKYHLYGGRGIQICERWLGSSGFANFLQDMGKKPSPKHSIERVNGDGNYEPSNCKWATQRQQMGNMSRNRLFTLDGVADTLTGHSRRYGINLHTVRSRMRQHGWSVEKAFKTPTNGRGANQTSY